MRRAQELHAGKEGRKAAAVTLNHGIGDVIAEVVVLHVRIDDGLHGRRSRCSNVGCIVRHKCSCDRRRKRSIDLYERR